MKRHAWILTAALLALSGCLFRPDTVPLKPADLTPVAGPRDAGIWGAVDAALPVEESPRTRYLNASDARRCPKLNLLTETGGDIKLRPGERGFAERGTVTLVVFCQLEVGEGRAAAQHVSDLVSKYGRYGVRAVGIVPRTPRSLELARVFPDRMGLQFPIYFDVLKGLKAMRKAVGADDELSKLVAIFIVDREQRVRFYRGEFPFVEQVGGRRGTQPVRRLGQHDEVLPSGAVTLVESTPEGRRVEDYLRIILSESY
ncbi:MAG: hypothetical protein GXY85_08600 [Candidatus Brocadiaceae bacterium]|nr:hypothetical protein [Candidatus Brocadiaceae bacterium]